MDPLPSESPEIPIRCPGCGQRFKVGPELQGRMVECGSCDQRFRVEEDVISTKKRFYPGEQKDPSLDRFGRVPMRSGSAPVFQPAHYEAQAPSQLDVEPTSPSRVIFGIVGVSLALIVASILAFGGAPGGMLDGTPMGKRLVLAGFTALICWILLFVANPHGRIKAALVGSVFAGVLLAIPFYFKDGIGGKGADDTPVEVALEPDRDDEDGSEVLDSEEAALEALKAEMYYAPMAAALEKYGPEGVIDGKTAIAVWLRGLKDFHKHQVMEYLVRSTGASQESWLYPRPPDDFFLVLIGVDKDLDAIKELSGRFGRVTQMIDELNVVEVKVNDQAFVQGSGEKLEDPNDPAFYELNKRELDSIDMRRANDAVKRLISAEPKLYRSDIVRRMHELLVLGDTEAKRNVAQALAVWAEEGDGSVPAVRKVAVELLEKEQTVPSTAIAFLVENRDQETIPILEVLWEGDTKEWEALFGDMGSMIEDPLLARFDSLKPTVKLSAIRLLGRVGTSKSLPVLKAAQASATSELGISLTQAIALIEKRQ